MVEAVMLWNEPNNISHWDFEIDPDWEIFSEMVNSRLGAIAQVNPRLPSVLGGISPIDPAFIATLRAAAACWRRSTWLRFTAFRSIGIIGRSTNGPPNSRRSERLRSLPLWVIGGRCFHLRRRGGSGVRAAAYRGIADGTRADRIHWYSLYDLPRAWPATTRHREAEGSSYYRHFYMGLLREDGTPKRALQHFSRVHAGARASASGSISKIIAWMTLCNGCAGWA